MKTEIQMSEKIAIEIMPVVDGEHFYYRTIVYDFLKPDASGNQTRIPREIFHYDTLQIAVEHLQELSLQGLL
jgi:hypothetical protein